jgi:hypothetical protein
MKWPVHLYHSRLEQKLKEAKLEGEPMMIRTKKPRLPSSWRQTGTAKFHHSRTGPVLDKLKMLI